MQKSLKISGVKPGCFGSRHSRGEEREPRPFGSPCLGFCLLHALHLTSKRAASWGAGETHQENSDHLTNLRRLAASPSPPCWVSISLKSSPSSLTQSFQNPADSEVPLWFQGFCLKPFSAALASFLTTLTPLPCLVLNKRKQSVLQPKKKKKERNGKPNYEIKKANKVLICLFAFPSVVILSVPLQKFQETNAPLPSKFSQDFGACALLVTAWQCIKMLLPT